MTSVGLHQGIPHADYLAWRAVSQSGLKVLRDKTPLHLRHWMDNPEPETPAMRLGSALHAAVLQPEVFAAQYAEGPDCNRGTKAWIAAEEAADGKELLKPAEWAMCMAMRDAVQAHPTVGKVLNGKFEHSAYWVDGGTGLPCKARFDFLSDRAALIGDLKTTADASPDAFMRSAYTYGYYLQAAHYLEAARALGLGYKHFGVIAVEKEPPYAVALYQFGETALAAGRQERARLMQAWKYCESTGDWYGYGARFDWIELPVWADRKISEYITGGDDE